MSATDTSSTDRLYGGSRIGDYVIDRERGDAFEATHVVLPRRVRLDIMPPTAVGQKPLALRMMRGACILEALRHPGVPRVYEVGLFTGTFSQRAWVASELVEGESLLELTTNGGRLAVRDVVCMLREAGEVLAYAHARGVAHRGIRPDAIVRGDGSRGFPLCVINWSEARLPETEQEQERLYADDVFALGLVGDLVLPSRTSAPETLVALIDDMLEPNPHSRPCAAEVAARAKLILDAIDAPLITNEDVIDDVIEEESVVLVDISRDAQPAQAHRARVRWTPPIGLNPTPSQGVVVGVIDTSRRRS